MTNLYMYYLLFKGLNRTGTGANRHVFPKTGTFFYYQTGIWTKPRRIQKQVFFNFCVPVIKNSTTPLLILYSILYSILQLLLSIVRAWFAQNLKVKICLFVLNYSRIYFWYNYLTKLFFGLIYYIISDLKLIYRMLHFIILTVF